MIKLELIKELGGSLQIEVGAIAVILSLGPEMAASAGAVPTKQVEALCNLTQIPEICMGTSWLGWTSLGLRLVVLDPLPKLASGRRRCGQQVHCGCLPTQHTAAYTCESREVSPPPSVF